MINPLRGSSNPLKLIETGNAPGWSGKPARAKKQEPAGLNNEGKKRAKNFEGAAVAWIS